MWFLFKENVDKKEKKIPNILTGSVHSEHHAPYR